MDQPKSETPPLMELNISCMAQRPPYPQQQQQQQQQQQLHAVGNNNNNNNNKNYHSISTKQIIDGINHAVTRPQRFHALQTALQAFSHNNTELHSYELDLGAVHALTLKMGYVLRSRFVTTTHHEEFASQQQELEWVCLCLQRVLGGCSSDRRVRAWQEMGACELLPLLLQVLRSAQQNSLKPSVLSVLRIFSKIEAAKPILVRYPGLVVTLISTLSSITTHASTAHFQPDEQRDQMSQSESSNGLQMQTICEVLGVIKDLSFRTSNDDKEVLFQTQGLREALLHVQGPEQPIKPREYISAIWWNLAMAPNVAVDMAQSDWLLSTWKEELDATSQERSHSRTQRNTISALGNLASVSENQEKLALDEELWGHLRRIVTHDADTDSRRRAMRTIRCLSSHPAFQRDELLDFLSRVASSDADRDTRVQALESMHSLHQRGRGFVDSLIPVVETSLDARMTLAACRILVASGNSILVDHFSPAFFQSIQAALIGSVESHEIVSQLMSMGVQTGSEKVLCATSINILATLVGQEGPDFATTRRRALALIQSMASTEGNRRPLAEHDALLSAIVSFAMSTPEGQEKDNAKAIILNLVQEL